MNRYEQIIRSIQPADSQARQEAASYIDSLIKPMGSLGRLETLAIDIAGITGNVRTGSLKKRTIVVMCSDNGVHEERVASAPQDVTVLMARVMAEG